MASAAHKLDQAATNWPEPEPLMPDRGQQAPFPIEHLEPRMRGAVEGISRLAYVPHALAAQSVLAASALAIQPHFDVQLPTGKIRPTSLFLTSIAESGDRKSTSDDFAMAAIRQFERDLEQEHGQQLADAQIRQAAWDEARKVATQNHRKQGREALESAYRDLGPRPEGPQEPVIVVRTGTTQGLLKRFLTSRPSLGLMSDEGGSYLGGYGMSEDNRLHTISTLSDFWDGTPVQMLTAGEGHTVLRGKRLSFHLMVQPIVADRLLGDAEALGQGFLSRILVSHPQSLAGTRIVDPTNRNDPGATRAVDEFSNRLSDIVRAKVPVSLETGLLQPELLKLDAGAADLWWDFYNEIEVKLGPGGEYQSIKGFVGKLPEMAARMAANLVVFAQGIRATTISAEGMLSGIALAQFYLGEALRLFGKTAAPKHILNAQALSDWLRDGWDQPFISVTDASRNAPATLRSRSDDIREALEVLDRHNHVIRMPDGAEVKGKRRREAWRVIIGRG